MKQKYYKLPVRLEKLFEGDIRQLERCSELESIDQHIELLLTTCPGEHRFDPKYGWRVWGVGFFNFLHNITQCFLNCKWGNVKKWRTMERTVYRIRDAGDFHL